MVKARKRSDYRYWLYSHRYSEANAFLNYVTSLLHDTGIRINILLVTSKKLLSEELSSWQPENFLIEVTNEEPVFTIRVTKVIDNHETVAMATVVRYSQNLPVYMIISDAKTGVFKETIAKLVDKHFPAISRIFLTNNEMRMIFDKLEDFSEMDMQVDHSVGKKRLSDTKKESQVTYTDVHYSEVFDQIDAHDQWVHSIRFYSKRSDRERSRGTIDSFSGLIARSFFFYQTEFSAFDRSHYSFCYKIRFCS